MEIYRKRSRTRKANTSACRTLCFVRPLQDFTLTGPHVRCSFFFFSTILKTCHKIVPFYFLLKKNGSHHRITQFYCHKKKKNCTTRS